jgi:hypothetical protein
MATQGIGQAAGNAGKAPNPAVVAAAAKAVAAKPAREVATVKMSDGRSVEFVGKRKLLKETIIDGQKVSVRLDFRNGETRLFPIPASLLLKSAGHGMEQKLGDETAGTEKVEDMVLEVDELIAQLAKGEWSTAREAGGFSGASVVIRAIMEASGKTQDQVKAFLQKKIDDAAARGEKMSRKALYDSFRNPTSKVGKIVERLEREERSGKAVVDADAALAELG